MLNHLKIHSRSNSPDAINSIRRSATKASGNVAKPMTSVFYDAIRLKSIRGRSSVLREGHFLTVLGEFEPQNVVGYRVDPKRHFLTTQRVFWAISREIPCTGYFSRRVREKIKKEGPYISRILPGAPLRPFGTNFGLRVFLVDIINCAKFYRNRLRCLDSMSGQSSTIPIGLRYHTVDPSPHQNPLTDLHKNWQAWLGPGRHPAWKIL